MGVTPKQAWAIAHLIQELRPEWEANGVVSAIKRVADRNAYHVALAAIRAAADPDARTPGVIPTTGDHWSEGIKEQPGKGRPPRKSEECGIHPGQWADICNGCAADRLTGERTAPAELRRPDRSNSLARARAELQSTMSRLCPVHHVQEIHCRGAHNDTTELRSAKAREHDDHPEATEEQADA